MALESGSLSGVTLNPAQQEMLGWARPLATLPYTPYPGQRVAPMTTLQQQAMSGIGGLGTGDFGQAKSYMNSAYGVANKNANYQSNPIANSYKAQMVNMFARPQDSAMFARPNDVNMYARPDKSLMFSRPDRTQMFAAPSDLSMFAKPGDVKSDFEAGEFDLSSAQKYMNPYQQAVTDIAKREAERMFQTQAVDRGLTAARQGAFGGSRAQIAESEARRNENQLLNDIQTKGLSEAYTNAQGQYERDRQARAVAAQMGLSADEFNAMQAMNYGLAGLDVGKFNRQQQMDYGKTGLQNDQFNSAQDMQYGQLGLQNNQFNIGVDQQFGRDDMARQQFNSDLGMRYGLAGLQNQQFNINTGMNYGIADLNRQQFNETSRYNQGALDLNGRIANETARQGAAGIRLNAGNMMLGAGSGLANIGQQQFSNALNKYNSMFDMGNTQWKVDQMGNALAMDEFDRQQQRPYQNLTWYSNLMSQNGVRPNVWTSSYQPDPNGGGAGSTWAGLGSLIGGALMNA